MAAGELLDVTIPSVRSYEGKSFVLEDASNVRIDEATSIQTEEDSRRFFSITVNIDRVVIQGKSLNDVTLVTEFGTRTEALYYLSQIERGIVSSADLIHLYAETTLNPESSILEIIEENSDLGMEG